MNMNPEQVKKFVEDYDSWLLQQADEYNNPHVSELTLRGTTLFDVEAEKDGKVETFKNVPMDYYKVIDVTDEDEISGRVSIPRWDDICDEIDGYFDFDELEYFELLDAEEENETQIPDGYKIVKILGFSEGHSFDDLEVE